MRTLYVVVLLAACGASDATQKSLVTDSAGVRVVRNTAPAWSAERGWRVDREPVLSIGTADGAAEYMLHQVGPVLRLSDGRVVVADNGSATLRYYDAAGRHLMTVGRHGSGPGEFQRISGIQRLAMDSLVIWDARLGRATIVDGSGRQAAEFGYRTGRSPSTLWRLSDGRWAAVEQTSMTAAGGTGLYRQAAYLLLAPADLARADTLGTFPGNEYAIVEFSGGFAMGPPPYARVFGFAVHDDRLYVAVGERLGWEVYSLDGSLVERVQSDVLDLALSERDRPAIKAAALEELSGDDDRHFAENYYSRVALPPARSAFSSFMIDARGDIWFSDSDRRTGTWRIHDASGKYLGEIELPLAFDLREVGVDYLLGVWRDDLGVETVRLLSLTRD